jgi:hypothetical protein
MTPSQQLVAYLSTLGAIVLLVLGAMLIGAFNVEVLTKTEAFGLGMAVGGLVGVLRIPTARNVTIDNPPSNPVQTEEAK